MIVFHTVRMRHRHLTQLPGCVCCEMAMFAAGRGSKAVLHVSHWVFRYVKIEYNTFIRIHATTTDFVLFSKSFVRNQTKSRISLLDTRILYETTPHVWIKHLLMREAPLNVGRALLHAWAWFQRGTDNYDYISFCSLLPLSAPEKTSSRRQLYFRCMIST